MVLVLFHAAPALTWASQPRWTDRLTVRQPHSLQPGEEDGAADQSAKLDEERTGNCTVALPKKFTGLQSARTWPSRRPATPPELENITHAKDGFFAPAESLPMTTLINQHKSIRLLHDYMVIFEETLQIYTNLSDEAAARMLTWVLEKANQWIEALNPM